MESDLPEGLSSWLFKNNGEIRFETVHHSYHPERWIKQVTLTIRPPFEDQPISHKFIIEPYRESDSGYLKQALTTGIIMLERELFLQKEIDKPLK